jgi:diguanylate cyclase (GGDEF)-like protein/PAS domain S-box-containing protein
MSAANHAQHPACRVLLVEDIATDAELEVRELRRAGMRVEHQVVETEESYRRALAEFAPDVILSDFSMPHFDGMFALSIARELRPHTPFIFVSGTIGEEYAIRALRDGATDYVLKSNLVRLPAAVERALADVRVNAARRAAERELEIARERLTSIFLSLEDVLWSAAVPSERLLYLSGAAAKVYGRDATAFTTEPDLWYGVIHPEDVERVRASRRGAVAGADYDIEYRILRPGGEQRWINDRARVVHDAAGAPVRMDGIARDVTEQMRQRQRIARLSRIRELLGATNAAIVRVRDRQALFEEFCRIAVSRGGLSLARVLTVDAGGQASIVATTESDSSLYQGTVDEYNRDPAGAQSLLADALRGKRPVVSNDVAGDERIDNRAALTRDGNYSLALLPLSVENRLDAIVVLRALEPGYFDQEELRLLRDMISNIAFALELMEKRDRVDYLAYYDPLTGLPNRALFHHQLSQGLDAARAGGQKAVVLVLDIERFKAINDTLGTQAGDSVLKRIAKLAKEAAGELTSIARLGGDQFALLVPAVRDSGHAGRRLDRLLTQALDTMLEVEGRELRVAAKAGIALYPDDGADAVAMLRNAESALKKAKETGERYVYYSPQLNERVAERVSLEARLRRAVERGEFLLHYQPRVSLAGNRIMGVEALLRWREGDAPMRSPAAYVPVLEETGLIQQVGQWAMREAVERHRAWVALGLAAPRIAVNVSAIQLRGRTFVEEVRAALGGAAGEAHGLDLEITESLLMENIEDSLRKLREIRALGIHLALDDFGTGYSSLAYLGRLPIDTVKIDRSFVHGMAANPGDTGIITAIVSLAQSLKLKVVAEGVETEQQARILRSLRCDEMQGYLFSPPVGEKELLELLAKDRRAIS